MVIAQLGNGGDPLPPRGGAWRAAQTPRHPPAPLSWDAHATIAEVGFGSGTRGGSFGSRCLFTQLSQRRACRARAVSFCLPPYPGVSATLRAG